MLIEGTLSQWNDTDGIGFVTPVQGEYRVRVVRALFPKNGPRPQLGEELWCEVAHCQEAVVDAISVRRTRLPIPPPQATVERTRQAPRIDDEYFPAPLAKQRQGIPTVVWLALLGVLAYLAYSQIDKAHLAQVEAKIMTQWEKFSPNQ